MSSITLKPIAHISNARQQPEDDNWSEVESQLVLVDDFPAHCLQGLEAYSHVEIIYHFHLVRPENIKTDLRHPRGNTDWPEVGIFAQRHKSRPNGIGATIAEIVKVEGGSLFLKNLDAIDGTPVLDIKPVMSEFLPKGAVQQPEWSKELMKNYW